jgi:hypothetical protein
LLDGADETYALAGKRADDVLVLAVVAHRLACRIDAAGQRRFGHDPSVPHSLDEIVLADDAVAVAQEVDQQVEHLRLDRNQRRSPA